MNVEIRDPIEAPDVIRALDRRASLPATLLAKESSCVLAAVAAKEHRVQFPEHPKTPLGRIVHDIIQDRLRSGEWDVDDRASLRDAIRVWEDAHAGDQISIHFIPLARAVGDDGLREAIQTIVRARAHTRNLARNPLPSPSSGSGHRPLPSSRSVGAWYEFPISDDSAGVNGRPDLVTSNGKGCLRVTDWKSGNVASGTPALRDALRQVQVYISILKHLDPRAVVSGCIVSASEIHEVPSAQADLAWIVDKSRVIRDTVSKLPDERIHEIAKPGSQCSNCPLRPACPSYREWLSAQRQRFKDLSARPDDDWHPTWHGDAWGIVERVEDGIGTRSIVLVDKEGNRSILRGLHHRHGLSSRTVGKGLAVYGLLVDSGSDGGRLLMSEIRFERRAWSALLLQERTTCR